MWHKPIGGLHTSAVAAGRQAGVLTVPKPVLSPLKQTNPHPDVFLQQDTQFLSRLDLLFCLAYFSRATPLVIKRLLHHSHVKVNGDVSERERTAQ